jgi:hypothetical protein
VNGEEEDEWREDIIAQGFAQAILVNYWKEYPKDRVLDPPNRLTAL